MSTGSDRPALPLIVVHAEAAAARGVEWPIDFFGQGGSNGSINVHNSSSTIQGRVLTSSRTAESPHQSRPTRRIQ